MEPLAQARFAGVARKAGHYESWYLKAGEPGGDRAVWIRYTVHKRPGKNPEGSLWFTFFDQAGGRPQAVKQSGPILPETGERYVGVDGLGFFAPDLAQGEISGAGRVASWHLEIADGESPLQHLPSQLYSAPLPRTKLLTLRPAAHFTGWIEVGGNRLAIDSWPGMIGHNWGSQHAERWVWLHGTDFDGCGPDSWIDLALGRVRIGPWTTPWVANGAISIDGERHRLGGIGRLRRTRVDARAGVLEVTLPGDGLEVVASAAAPTKDTVAWRYADPDGSEHHTLNCSISSLSLTVRRPDGTSRELTTACGCAYEYGSRDFDHGVPVEPFGDG